MAMSEERHAAMDKTLNHIMAIFLPLIELGSIGYASYVFIYLICTQYLINPDPRIGLESRQATGIALIIVYCILVVVFLVTFLRLLQVIWANPGLTSLGEPTSEKHVVSTKHFDRLDAYVCDYQGWPLWCDKCHNWKPDRAHHSSQLQRCVRRMDHYCPYAGGIISETTHKFFIQFLFYGFLFTGYALIVMAVFLAERINKLNSHPATWIVALGLAAFFFMFTFGMFMTSFYNMSINYTTVEIMQKGSVYNIALLGRSPAQSTSSDSQQSILCEIQRTKSRPYVVVQTQPFDNPWDMGFWNNVRAVMGNSFIDWFIPLKMSPCTMQSDQQGEYGWGKVVQKMMVEYNAGSVYAARKTSRSSRQRRSSRTNSNMT